MPRNGTGPLAAGAPASTASSSTTSATERAIGPIVSLVRDNGTTPPVGYLPTVGRKPTSPHNEAGCRTDPPVSAPSPAGTIPAATAVAVPPLLPPAISLGSYGLRAGPVTALFDVMPNDISCITVFPASSPDAARSRATAVLSVPGTRPCNAAVPSVVGASQVSMLSLTASGTPANSPTPYDPTATALWGVSSSTRCANAFNQLWPLVRACNAARYSVCEMRPAASSCRTVRIV